MDFAELVALLQNPGEDGVPDTIYDDLTASYNGMSEGSAAKIAEQSEQIQALNGEISRLKAANYDLLMQAKGDDEPPADNSGSDDEGAGIDDLFGKDED